MNLTDVDLTQLPCPRDTIVDIEELGRERVPIPCECLRDGIGVVYSLLSGKATLVDENFQQRITLLEINKENRFHPLVKVRIAPAP